MREIVLQPGTAIEIDGVIIRAAAPKALMPSFSGIYDPAIVDFVQAIGPELGGDPMLDPESLALLRTSVARWIESGDFSQAHLLRSATHEVARVMSVLLRAEQIPSGAASAPSSHPEATGTRE